MSGVPIRAYREDSGESLRSTHDIINVEDTSSYTELPMEIRVKMMNKNDERSNKVKSM